MIQSDQYKAFLAKVHVPAGGTIVSPNDYYGRHTKKKDTMIRTDILHVDEIENPDNLHIDKCFSWFMDSFKYEQWKTYKEPELDKNPHESCAKGLHLFVADGGREDAILWGKAQIDKNM